MNYLWSPAKKFSTWRKLWLALAEVQADLGLDITEEQLEEMRNNLTNIDFALAEEKESVFRHDVMAHVHTFGVACPKAMPIIHLGATSCFVGDNTDLIQIKESLVLVQEKLVNVLAVMKQFAEKYKSMPTLGFTHFQPAQLTTVGKRCTLWMQDLVLDFTDLEGLIADLPMRGVKGTTGTQATFLELFDGDHEKVKALNKLVCEKMGFNTWLCVSGQTYSRKIDFKVLSVLSGIAQSAYKMCSDIRLLASMKEIEEPFGKNQIGSSAMAYKRNPMRSERVCSLSRYIMSLPVNAAQTHANQWFERTLDDSAVRRIVLPEGFLATDVVLSTLLNIADGLHVWPAVIRSHISLELPFMATEVILMQCVKAGGDRQVLHEAIREHSMAAGMRVKEEGAANDLLERVAADPLFTAVHDTLDQLLDPAKFVGRAPEQVADFMEECVDPILAAYADKLGKAVVDVNV
ncbi:adenylosuccinate lyase [Ochromonadaceae sp. CCMP2298]|nr:adenylosuccinate lyase [Ochromonadaceae sp. CCMP2298]